MEKVFYVAIFEKQQESFRFYIGDVIKETVRTYSISSLNMYIDTMAML